MLPIMIHAEAKPPHPAHLLGAVVGLGTVIFAVAFLCIELSARAQGVSPVWLTNAVAVAFLLRRPAPEFRAGLATACLAMIGANVATGSAPWPALAMAVINALEIAGIVLGMRALGGRGSPLGDLVRFVSLAAIGAGASALAAGAALALLAGASFLIVLSTWFMADLCGLLIIVPPAIGVTREAISRLVGVEGVASTLACVSLTAGVTLGVFGQEPYPLLFCVLPCLILSTYVLGYPGAAISNAAAVVAAIGMTAAGSGPIAFHVADPLARSLVLQVFLVLNALVVFPLAAIVAQRTSLIASLRERESRARRVTELAPTGILRVLPDGTISEANPGVAEVTGRQPDNLVGMRMQYLLSPDASMPALDWQDATKGPTKRIEVAVTGQGNEARYVELAATPQVGADGQVTDWVVILTDIDERRQGYLRLEASERLHRLLAENSHDMVVRISMSGVRLYVSPACERLLGYRPDEMIGATPIAAIHPDDRARVAEVARTLLTGAVDPTCTYRQRHRDGHWVWLEAVYRLMRDPDTGEPIEFIASVRDVSKRRAAEMSASEASGQLREKNRLLMLAEGLAGVGHYRLDLVGGGLVWSDEVYRIYAAPRDVTPTLEYAIGFYHPDDRERVAAIVNTAIETGESFSFQGRIVRADGELRWVQANGQAESAPNGQAVGLVGVFQDITERIESERRLIKARQEAEEALRARSVFTSTMSHEIRTPLAGVLAATELLDEAAAPAEQRRYLETLKSSGRLLSSIIDDVLVFAKLDEGAVELESVAFDLAHVVEDTVAAFEASAHSKGLLLRLLGSPRQARVLGDPTRIQRVLANLLSNAIKFTSEGSVAVDVERESGRPDWWRFTVTDTGEGVPLAQRERIFDPFVQADASVARRHGGTGLGLAICRHLVDAMGGCISVGPNRGGGAVFTFSLSLPGASDADDGAGTDEHASPKLRLLVAEDNHTNRYLLISMLERMGHEVVAVENGARALLAVRAQLDRPFDFILMDVQMPEMDGVSATREIRLLPEPAASTVICAITAEDSADRRRWIRDAGMDEVLGKPISVDALTRLLRSFGSDMAATPGWNDAAAPTALPEDGPSAIDPDRLRSIETTLGIDGRNRMLELLVEDAAERPRIIRRCFEVGQTAQIAVEAHGLKGAASIVGAEPLIAVLRKLEDAARDDAVEERLLAEVDVAAAAVVAAGRTALQAADACVPTVPSNA